MNTILNLVQDDWLLVRGHSTDWISGHLFMSRISVAQCVHTTFLTHKWAKGNPFIADMEGCRHRGYFEGKKDCMQGELFVVPPSKLIGMAAG
jgi:hypothetical protein